MISLLHPTLAVTTGQFLLAALFVVAAVLLVLVVLVQKPRGGGLSGAFGGGGGAAQSMFGGKTGDALTKLTIGFFVAFVLLAMGITWATKPPVTPTNAVTTSQPANP